MDQSKFINTYIDIVVATVVEYVKTNLQLQTQVAVNEFVVAEKDKVIESLNRQLSENVVAEDWKRKYEAAEANYSAILGKVGHMDTLLAQVGEMKKMISERDLEITNIKEQLSQKEKEIDELKNPIPAAEVINTKVKKKAEQPVKATEKNLDDF